MIKMKIYVFDLDNTLIYTDSLNNNSYNYALNLYGLSSISDRKRITRDIVSNQYPNLNNIDKSVIIKLKQAYFLGNLQNTLPNISLIRMLKNINTEFCMLWTSSDETRALAILEYYDIRNSFGKILFSDKVNLNKDTKQICELFKCRLENL